MQHSIARHHKDDQAKSALSLDQQKDPSRGQHAGHQTASWTTEPPSIRQMARMTTAAVSRWIKLTSTIFVRRYGLRNLL
jgi:hypothetical protein